jgi:DNA-binding response OmpR family regulator
MRAQASWPGFRLWTEANRGWGKAFAKMKQVLLVDDDPSQLAVRQLLLSRSGIDSQLSTEARQALQLLRSEAGREAIGAVVTDHVMPEVDGVAFVREVRSFDPTIPVIVVSGLPDIDDAYDGLDVLILSKPCEPEALIATIRNALTRGQGGSSYKAS